VAITALLAGGSASQGRPSTGGLTAWDGQWYLTIIRFGYGRPPVAHQWSTWPFFPLMPGIARALAILGVPPRWGLVAIANVAFAIALGGVWRLGRGFGSNRVAVIAVWAVAAAPFASVFSMGYPSSVFLAASTWAFVFLNSRRDVAAGFAGAVATLARPNGAVVLVALAIVVLSWSRSAPGGQSPHGAHRVGVVCGPGVVALTLWCFELWRWTRNPLVFWTAKTGWNELTLVTFVRMWARDGWPHILVAAVAISLVLVTARRLPLAWVAMATVYLLPSFGLGIVGLGRYSGECFPAIIACGIALESAPRLLLRSLAAVSALAMGVLALAIATHGLVP
jgi:hypothetical protein